MVKPLLGVALLIMSFTVRAADTPSFEDSTIINSELDKIYNMSDTANVAAVGAIPLWTGARVVMSTLRNKTMTIQIEDINRGAYQQGLYDPDISKSVSPAKELVTNHFALYGADSASNERANYKCQEDIVLQHADIKLSTLLSGFRYDDSGRREDAARLFLNNVIEPFPSDKLSVQTAINAESIGNLQSREDVAKALAAQALLSVAREPFAEMIAKRSLIGGGVNKSFMEIMEKEAAQRFLNDAWQKEMQQNITRAKADNKPEKAALYEVALMEAYRNWMEYERYRQAERIEALLAATLAFNYRQAAANAEVLKQTTQSIDSSSSSTSSSSSDANSYSPDVD
jgi:hypothetical protein